MKNYTPKYLRSKLYEAKNRDLKLVIWLSKYDQDLFLLPAGSQPITIIKKLIIKTEKD